MEWMKLKLYITRHGETEWNTIGKMQGWQNSNLTEKGIEDAIKLGESFEELFERVEKSLKYIIENSTDENILIVSHALTIKVIYSIVNNYKIEKFWTLPHIDGTSLTILEIDGDEMKFTLEADTSHYL